MSEYSEFRRAFRFGQFTYCFACGAPNDSKKAHYYPPACHEPAWYKSKDVCPFAHLAFKVMFALWFRDDLRPQFCTELGIQASNLSQFTNWAIQDHNHLQATTYFNGMMLLLWYCQYVGFLEA